MLSYVIKNSPRRKPELWENLVGSLRRQAMYRLKKTLAPHKLAEPVSTVYDRDIRFSLNLRDTCKRSIYLYGYHEYATTKLLGEYLTPGMSFYDVGANGGYFTLFAAKRVGPRGAVFAFEPVEERFQELQANVGFNTFSNIKAYQLAVADRDGVVELNVDLSENNSGLSSLVGDAGGRRVKRAVSGLTLDKFIRESAAPPPDIIKIDVEGAERLVFEGASATLTRQDGPDLIFECHQDSGEISRLESFGYEVFKILLPCRGAVLAPYASPTPERLARGYEPPNFFATKRSGSAALSALIA